MLYHNYNTHILQFADHRKNWSILALYFFQIHIHIYMCFSRLWLQLHLHVFPPLSFFIFPNLIALQSHMLSHRCSRLPSRWTQWGTHSRGRSYNTSYLVTGFSQSHFSWVSVLVDCQCSYFTQIPLSLFVFTISASDCMWQLKKNSTVPHSSTPLLCLEQVS